VTLAVPAWQTFIGFSVASSVVCAAALKPSDVINAIPAEKKEAIPKKY